MEENDLAAILAAKRSAGVTPEVNLREHVTHMPPPSVNKAAYSGFETQRDVTRSCPAVHRGISGSAKRTYIMQIFLKNALLHLSQ